MPHEACVLSRFVGMRCFSLRQSAIIPSLRDDQPRGVFTVAGSLVWIGRLFENRPVDLAKEDHTSRE